MTQLSDYHTSEEGTSTTCYPQEMKRLTKQKNRARKSKKKAKQLKQKLKLERRLNKEREQRYQMESELKCALFLLRAMAKSGQSPLLGLSGGYGPVEGGGDEL